MKNLYKVSDFMQCGDRLYHLHSQNRFPEKKAKFYLIEIILGLETLHKNNMIYFFLWNVYSIFILLYTKK